MLLKHIIRITILENRRSIYIPTNYEETFANQKVLVESMGYSIGVVNHSLKILKSKGFLTDQFQLMEKAIEHIGDFLPQNAIIPVVGLGV